MPPHHLHLFSPRQAAIAALVADGLHDKEIAYRLGISIATVRTHLRRMYVAHAVAGRVGLARRWFEAVSGLAPEPIRPVRS